MNRRHLKKIHAPARQPRSRSRFFLAFPALLFSLHLFIIPVGHAQDALSEYQVKAAYLFNFLKFVEYPDESFRGPARADS